MAWYQGAFFYQIFPDRFFRAGPPAPPAPTGPLEPWEAPPTLRGFKGGTLFGVAEKLPYLLELGVEAIYLNPVFASTANHRYHTVDYFQVDPLLGGNGALRHLLEVAHAHGVRVILDGVFNHTGRGFFAFQHLLENGPESPYRDWYYVKGFPLNAYGSSPNYEAWWGNPELPKLKVETPEVRAYLLKVAEHWIRFGADGWRLDVPNEIQDLEFWREFRRRVKGANPEAYIVGEIWEEADLWLRGDLFDATMNYPLGRAVLGFVGGEALDRELATRSGLGRIEPLQALAFSHRLEDLFRRYPWEAVTAQMNLLTSHDTPRLLTLLRGEVARARLALSLLFLLPGNPTVYYGEEIGMEGGHDPENRGGMVWDEARWKGEIREAIRRMAALRKAHPLLKSAPYTRIYAQDGHLAFARGPYLVVVNATDRPFLQDLPLHGHFPRGGAAVDLLSGAVCHPQGGRLCGPELPPFSLAVWQEV
ncbi:glycoside hydrolase family 13 protein [Thermus oshimai]|uniref:glycoside hydrolase family 13 protein n=1 Tax=Thermus oshimai TaxID=56957 RepID=UPI00037E2076|nr:glycoside hydrolase family 13 protein [Thermus oshimai]